MKKKTNETSVLSRRFIRDNLTVDQNFRDTRSSPSGDNLCILGYRASRRFAWRVADPFLIRNSPLASAPPCSMLWVVIWTFPYFARSARCMRICTIDSQYLDLSNFTTGNVSKDSHCAIVFLDMAQEHARNFFVEGTYTAPIQYDVLTVRTLDAHLRSKKND